ncbi:hypothetical protein RRL34_002601 [Vibrio parahaemolyticus]|nr:hypothetical protein [Vibrio parahaemolyticus]
MKPNQVKALQFHDFVKSKNLKTLSPYLGYSKEIEIACHNGNDSSYMITPSRLLSAPLFKCRCAVCKKALSDHYKSEAERRARGEFKSNRRACHGWGINDLSVSSTIDKSRPRYRNGVHDGYQNSKLYSTWNSMIQRAHSADWQQKYPSYADVRVCDEWQRASEFEKWFDANYVEGWQLDKDLFSETGHGVLYSAETCVFLPREINIFLMNMNSDSARNRDLKSIKQTATGRYSVRTRDKCETFDTLEEAKANVLARYKARAQQLIDKYQDVLSDRVIDRLKVVYGV